MRSHIFPQSLLKQWIKDIWEHSNKRVSLFVVDLTKRESFLVKEILNEDDIKSVLNQKRVFYLNIEDSLISEYEKEWNKDYEEPFLKIYQQLLKIHNKYFDGIDLKEEKKESSYNKEIAYAFKTYSKSHSVVLNFLYLSLFRGQFVQGLTKIIYDDGDVRYENLSEMRININIAKDKDDIRNSFDKFQKSFRMPNYMVFVIPNRLYFMCNPPVYHYDDIFFAIPFSPFGFLCLLDLDYEIKYIEEGNFKFQKTSKGYGTLCTIEDIFDFDSKYTLDFVVASFANNLLKLWLGNYGYAKGEIYFLGNRDSIIDFMNTLNQSKFFRIRRTYINNDNNYDWSNTIFAIKKK